MLKATAASPVNSNINHVHLSAINLSKSLAILHNLCNAKMYAAKTLVHCEIYEVV